MRRRRFSLDIRPGAVALLAGLYFLLPLRWCARLALAVTVHELGHVAALVLCGTEIYGLRMEGCGLALRCAPPEGTARTVAAAVSGPAAGVGLFCILRGLGYPEGADLSLLYTCVNLLPVLPLDGGPRAAGGSRGTGGGACGGAAAGRAGAGAAGRADGAWRGAVCARDGTRTGRIWRVACTFAAGNDLPRGKT